MTETQIEPIAEKVEGFLAKTGMAPSTFGVGALNSGAFVTHLRLGRKSRPATVAKVDNFIREQEAKHMRRLNAALDSVRARDGYVQMNGKDEPMNLPPDVTEVIFRQLIETGQLAPSNDSFLGGKPQTYRPI